MSVARISACVTVRRCSIWPWAINGYTVCSGVISHELNGPGIISIPLDVDEYMEIGIITRKNTTLTRYGRAYIDAIRQHI